MAQQKQKRLAVIDRDLCNPKATGYACIKACPVNRSGQDCIVKSELDKKPLINEELCIGCGICVKKCSRNAIQVVNLPGELHENPIHRYGRNLFSLYRLPIPKKNSVVGMIGPNGVGKSTVLNILSGQFKPNTGIFGKDIPWEEITERFKGTELQGYMEKLAGGKIKTGYKPQQVDLIPKKWRGPVRGMLKKIDEGKNPDRVMKELGMGEMLNKKIEELSGGELQILAIAATLLKECDFYFFDEPSSYLDVYQRLVVAKEIRKLAEKSFVMVVEHDLAVADYLADYTHILYGRAGVFGAVSKPYGVRVGINTYLEGYIREENMRFRPEPIIFGKAAKSFGKTNIFLSYSGFKKSLDGFSLKTEPGNLYKGEILGILGPNAIGKTTFIKLLTGELKPEKGEALRNLRLAYKPQRLVLEKEHAAHSVQDYVREQTGKTNFSTEEKTMLRFLGVEKLFERMMNSLSGGEIQAVFISCALLKESDIILLDEPSAFLDVEQRLRVAKLLRQISEASEKPCFVVDHDLQFIDVLSDRVLVFDGEPGKKGYSQSPFSLEEGMNRFLKALGITYRRDPHTGRPRANKPGSQKDMEQKQKGKYYYME